VLSSSLLLLLLLSHVVPSTTKPLFGGKGAMAIS
jgi:hypothetical protein